MAFTFTKAALGAALLAASMLAPAQDKGARISDGIVKIGVLTDIAGPFMDNVGKGSIVATEIAIEEFGGKVGRALPSAGFRPVVAGAERSGKRIPPSGPYRLRRGNPFRSGAGNQPHFE